MTKTKDIRLRHTGECLELILAMHFPEILGVEIKCTFGTCTLDKAITLYLMASIYNRKLLAAIPMELKEKDSEIGVLLLKLQ